MIHTMPNGLINSWSSHRKITEAVPTRQLQKRKASASLPPKGLFRNHRPSETIPFSSGKEDCPS